jgi:hypothetical protein
MKNNSKEADRIQEPPEFAVKFANAVFVLGLLFSFLIIIYAIYRIYNPIYSVHLGDIRIQKLYFIYILIGGISATLFGLGLRLKNSLKVKLSVLFVATGISVYAFETYLEFSRIQVQTMIIEKIATKQIDPRPQIAKKQIDPRQQMAEKMGVPYDTRTKIEVLEDLRRKKNDEFLI